MRWLRVAWVLPIRFYRRFVTVWTPPTCRFRPTCSAYAEEAVLAHGVAKGTLLACWRILRCQPFSAGGRDPVPGPGRWRPDPPAAGPPPPTPPPPPPQPPSPPAGERAGGG